MYVHVYGIFVAVPLNREQIFYMCGIYAHGREPGEKTVCMYSRNVRPFYLCTCELCACIHGNCNVPIVITVHVHTQGERRV